MKWGKKEPSGINLFSLNFCFLLVMLSQFYYMCLIKAILIWDKEKRSSEQKMEFIFTLVSSACRQLGAHHQPTSEREIGRKLHPLPSAPLATLRNGAENSRGKPEPSASLHHSWQQIEKGKPSPPVVSTDAHLGTSVSVATDPPNY